LISALTVMFGVRAFEQSVVAFWSHYAALAAFATLAIVVGSGRRSAVVPFLLMPLLALLIFIAAARDPWGWGVTELRFRPSVYLLGFLLVAMVWLGRYLWLRYRRQSIRRRAMLRYGTTTLWSALGCLFIAVWLWPHVALKGWEWGLLLACGVYLGMSLWNDRQFWRVGPWAIFSLTLAGAFANWAIGWLEPRALVWWSPAMLSAALMVLAWAAWLTYFPWLRRHLANWHIPRLTAWQRQQQTWLPIFSAAVAAILVPAAFVLPSPTEGPIHWQISCLVPLVLGLAFVLLANAVQLAWTRYTAIGLLTLAALFQAWRQPDGSYLTAWTGLVQTYWVLGVGFLVYGFAIAHWLQRHDAWRSALQRGALVLMALAGCCLLLIVSIQTALWMDDDPLPASVRQAVAITVMSLGIAAAMIVIALLPRQQPVALSMRGRQVYVYLAQVVLAVTVGHVALSMPWLFAFGIRQYWPYLAMGLAFGGIGLWHLLDRRQLLVLSQPLATSLLIFPALAALLALGLESRADRSVVMLLCGAVYGCLVVTHPGLWTRLLSLGFGNLALWLLIDRYPDLAFQQHPQLWLIPPAVAVLLISRWEARRLGPQQTMWLRYLAVATIYISSTSEIFIQGIGQSLAPPMILASLALLGMLAGMALKIQEYVFLGALFLLVAMFTMVSHAHQQLNHVWPWWVFGISLGVATLIFFGIFEQRRNRRRRQLEQDAE